MRAGSSIAIVPINLARRSFSQTTAAPHCAHFTSQRGEASSDLDGALRNREWGNRRVRERQRLPSHAFTEPHGFLSLFYNGACERYRLSFAAITFPIGQLMLARSMGVAQAADRREVYDDYRTSSLTLVTIPFDEGHGSGRPAARHAR